MKKQTFQFTTASVDYYFDASIQQLKEIVTLDNTIIITDETIDALHHAKYAGFKKIVVPSGEQHKNQPTVDGIINQLIALEADRKTTLVGIGGGVVTDMTGYVASIYMRGIAFGFVPTTLLAMVDASIGGKNGIDVGIYKNMVGIIRQPKFLLYDVSLLSTLTDADWSNGFAEIIKHACIKDAAMFDILKANTLANFQQDKTLLAEIVERNARLKTTVVQHDEFEQGERKLLNFGHTLGHAIENEYQLYHGQAVAIGMAYASLMSSQLLGFQQTEEVTTVLANYGLPTSYPFDKAKAIVTLKMDKKREQNTINYILLEAIGKGVIRQIPIIEIENIIQAF
ncbi:3-dehydroquinate synthase [Parasediminibacterium sp. JCM 36343]|uniref:3-dehydroquinate synthase n=1 Tax=Parasediminibacterium sp. JCM 36343 TaxID=3374279 RepID=UPI00397CCD62